jgi:hypothetical protein
MTVCSLAKKPIEDHKFSLSLQGRPALRGMPQALFQCALDGERALYFP